MKYWKWLKNSGKQANFKTYLKEYLSRFIFVFQEYFLIKVLSSGCDDTVFLDVLLRCHSCKSKQFINNKVIGYTVELQQLKPWSLVYLSWQIAQNLMALLLFLTRTHSWVPMIPYIRLLWSNCCIYVFMLLFSFSVFCDQWSLKIENGNNSTKTLTAEAPYIGLESLEFSL